MLWRLWQHPRTVYGVILLSCISLLATGYVFEYVFDIMPCPLCMVQRLIFMAVAAVALIGLLHGSIGFFNRLYSFFLGLFALAGVAVAARQVWLQHLPPDQVPECGPDFAFIVGHFPILNAIDKLWKGSGSCAEVQWVFLGLSIPGWALVWFSFFVLLVLFQGLRRWGGEVHKTHIE